MKYPSFQNFFSRILFTRTLYSRSLYSRSLLREYEIIQISTNYALPVYKLCPNMYISKLKKEIFVCSGKVEEPEDPGFNLDKHSKYAFVFLSSPNFQVHSDSTLLRL